MSHDASMCARGNNPNYVTGSEEVTFILGGSFSGIDTLQVWYSDLKEGNTSPQLFVKLPALKVVDNRVTITVNPEEIYTLTTLTTGNKGSHTPPVDSDFPLPYHQTFDDEVEFAPAALWYDQMGAWEVHARDDGKGQAMKQVSDVWPACWG